MARRSHTSRQAIKLLSVLSEGTAEWSYGYDLCTATGLASGTLYPILARLNDHGLLEAKWKDSPIEGRPRRHLYKLNAKGRALAQDRIDEFGIPDADWSIAT